MNVIKCKELLREKKFDELINTLESEFENLYKDMLDYCNLEYDKDWKLQRLGSEVSKRYSSYFNTIILCENVLYSGEYDYGDSIDILINSYSEMSKHYKERLDGK